MGSVRSVIHARFRDEALTLALCKPYQKFEIYSRDFRCEVSKSTEPASGANHPFSGFTDLGDDDDDDERDPWAGWVGEASLASWPRLLVRRRMTRAVRAHVVAGTRSRPVVCAGRAAAVLWLVLLGSNRGSNFLVAASVRILFPPASSRVQTAPSFKAGSLVSRATRSHVVAFRVKVAPDFTPAQPSIRPT